MLSIISKCGHLSKFGDISKMLRTVSSQAPTASSEKPVKRDSLRRQILDYRHVYPEFLPDPKIEFRNSIRERLERNDMVARRTQIDIPEFYVENAPSALIRLLLVENPPFSLEEATVL